MGFLFLLALFLAWPTYGLSLIVWIALSVYKSSRRTSKIAERDSRQVILEPLFNQKFADFFKALDMPLLHGQRIAHADAHTCGRHIMRYLAHNPEEAALFIQGLKRWYTKGGPPISDPVTAAEMERQFNMKGEVHLTSYRAVEALMMNNLSLKCFDAIDHGKLIELRSSLELEKVLQSQSLVPA